MSSSVIYEEFFQFLRLDICFLKNIINNPYQMLCIFCEIYAFRSSFLKLREFK